MYIAPTSVIRLLKGVPLDPKYQHTLYFEDKEQQRIYFAGKLHKSIMDGTYQRVNVGVTRFNQKADELYNCNYMMFQNGSYGDKWFYAFITKIEYVNDAASNVYFEIDVMQTWLFDIELKQCLVEREHSLTDEVGGNIVAESVDIGPLRSETAQTSGLMSSYVAVIATAYGGESGAGGYFGGTFTGLKYVAGLIDNNEDVERLLNLLNSLVELNQIEAIASIFTMPSYFFTTGSTPKTARVDVNKQQAKIGSYVPKNKKLLTYPFNFLYAHNSCGSSAIYRYEWFQGSSCGFVLECAMGCNPEIIAEAIAYDNQQFNVDEKIVLSGFPQVGYAIDSFKAWLAQESSATAISAIGSGAALAAGAVTGNPVAIAGGAIGMASSINSVVMASIKPDTPRGSQGNNTLVGTREKDFYFINKHITEDYAKMIDNFFDMYGYATYRVKVPNRNSRPHWNYVKTQDCVAVGNCPSDDLKQVCSIYDKGVTFWKKPSEVGKYNLINSPE